MNAVELLVATPLPAVEAALAQDFKLHRLADAPDREELLREIAPRVRGLLTGGKGADARLMDALPHLEIVACHSVGVEKVDLAHAASRGIQVTYTPDVNSDDVADLALALLLTVVRRVIVGDRFVRSGGWQNARMPLSGAAGGKKMGIVGLGSIGRAIARRAEAFNIAVSYYGRTRKSDVDWPFNPDLVALARDSDYLMVSVAGGPQTRRLIDKPVLEALGAKGILINVARGSVVDEAAMVTALEEGKLGGAGLDVFQDEPNVPAPLLAMDQVVLQPHVGSATHRSRIAMADLVVRNIRSYVSEGSVLTPVHPPA